MRRNYLVDLIPAANDGLGLARSPHGKCVAELCPATKQAATNRNEVVAGWVGLPPLPHSTSVPTSVFRYAGWSGRRGGRIGSNGPDDRDLLVSVGGLVIVYKETCAGSSVRNLVYELRRALGKHGEMIQAVRGKGYLLTLRTEKRV